MHELFRDKPWVAPVLTLDSTNPTSSFSDNIDKIDKYDNIDKKRKNPLCKTELSSKRKYYRYNYIWYIFDIIIFYLGTILHVIIEKHSLKVY